jgi:hypothetical protein
MFAGMRSISVKYLAGAALIAILLWSCTGSDEAGKSEGNGGEEYVQVTVIKDGKPLQLSVRPNAVDAVMRVDSIMHAYKGEKLEKEELASIDVTGDSLPEAISARVWMKDGKCMISHTVKAADSVIWFREIEFEDAYGGDLYGEDSAYYKLLPYSAFAEGLYYVNVASEGPGVELFLRDTVSKNMTEVSYRDDLKEQGLDEFDIEEKMIQYRKYLRSFKGHLVYSLSIMNGDVYIWYEPEKRFVLLYAP